MLKEQYSLMRRSQTCLSWGSREREKRERESKREVTKSCVAALLCSTDRLVIKGSYSLSDGRRQLPKKLIDTHILFTASLLFREGSIPILCKVLHGHVQPRAKISPPYGYGLSAPNPFILISLNPGKAWLETRAL